MSALLLSLIMLAMAVFMVTEVMAVIAPSIPRRRAAWAVMCAFSAVSLAIQSWEVAGR